MPNGTPSSNVFKMSVWFGNSNKNGTSKLSHKHLKATSKIRFPHKSGTSKLSHKHLKAIAKMTQSFVRCAFGTRKAKQIVTHTCGQTTPKLTQSCVQAISFFLEIRFPHKSGTSKLPHKHLKAPQSNRKDDSTFCAVHVWHKEN